MNPYRLSLYILLLAVAVTSCYEEPEFPIEPRLVGFDGITFKENLEGPDTLQIRVMFEDGDGDLGLAGSGIDREPPFNEINLIPDAQGNPIRFNANNPNLPPFDCENYYIVKDSLEFFNGKLLKKGDTLLAEYNKFGRNLDIHLFVKKQEGYEEYNFRSIRTGCVPPLGGRFPRLKDNFDNDKPRKGVIQYQAVSPVLLPLFRNDTLKIQVQIRDRALHESNIIESEPFTLRGAQIE